VCASRGSLALALCAAALALVWQEYFTCVVKGQVELERFRGALEAEVPEVRQAFGELEGAVIDSAVAARGGSFVLAGLHALDQRAHQKVCVCV
jgi:hypothetical protein